MQGTEQRRRARKVAFSLVDSRLGYKGVDVVRRNDENLIKLSQRFSQTRHSQIGKCVLREETDVARVEPLGFVEVRLTSLPLASPTLQISEGLRNQAAIGQ